MPKCATWARAKWSSLIIFSSKTSSLSALRSDLHSHWICFYRQDWGHPMWCWFIHCDSFYMTSEHEILKNIITNIIIIVSNMVNVSVCFHSNDTLCQLVCSKANNTDWYMKLDDLLRHILPVLIGNAGLQNWYDLSPSEFVLFFVSF